MEKDRKEKEKKVRAEEFNNYHNLNGYHYKVITMKERIKVQSMFKKSLIF